METIQAHFGNQASLKRNISCSIVENLLKEMLQSESSLTSVLSPWFKFDMNAEVYVLIDKDWTVFKVVLEEVAINIIFQEICMCLGAIKSPCDLMIL